MLEDPLARGFENIKQSYLRFGGEHIDMYRSFLEGLFTEANNSKAGRFIAKQWLKQLGADCSEEIRTLYTAALQAYEMVTYVGDPKDLIFYSKEICNYIHDIAEKYKATKTSSNEDNETALQEAQIKLVDKITEHCDDCEVKPTMTYYMQKVEKLKEEIDNEIQDQLQPVTNAWIRRQFNEIFARLERLEKSKEVTNG